LPTVTAESNLSFSWAANVTAASPLQKINLLIDVLTAFRDALLKEIASSRKPNEPQMSKTNSPR
jgi:hypothetical protein